MGHGVRRASIQSSETHGESPHQAQGALIPSEAGAHSIGSKHMCNLHTVTSKGLWIFNLCSVDHDVSWVFMCVCFRLIFNWSNIMCFLGLPRWHSSKESSCQCKRHRFDPWVGKIPWSRKWQPTAVFLPGKFHGQKNLADYIQSMGSQSRTWLSDWAYMHNRFTILCYVSFCFDIPRGEQ